MPSLIRSSFIYAIIFAFINSIFPGLIISDGIKGIALSGILLTLIIKIIKPVIKALLLPINLITMGSLKWIINIINIAVLQAILPQFTLDSFYFNGFNYGQINIQGFEVSKLLSLVIIALSILPLKKLFIKIVSTKQ